MRHGREIVRGKESTLQHAHACSRALWAFMKYMATSSKPLSKDLPDSCEIVLLTSNNQKGHTLRGSVFVRYRSEVNARAALSYFHGRQFKNQHLRVTLCNRETQLRVGDEKGKMAGGKAVSNENITLGREEIIQMEQYNAPMDECWGEIKVARAFRVEYQGEGRRAHQAH